MMKIKWITKKFDELGPAEVYDIIWLRNQVFVVEQNCVYQDADYKDLDAFHMYGKDEKGKIIVYCRIIPPGSIYKEPSIGRIVTSGSARGSGTGKELVQKAIDFIQDNYGKIPIRIGAQAYLKKFYEGFGFQQTGEIYDEDGIDHMEMLKSG